MNHTRSLWPAQETQARAIVLALERIDGGPLGWTLEISGEPDDHWRRVEARRATDDLTLALDWPEAYGADKHKPARLGISLVWPYEGGKGQRRIVRTPYGEAEPTTAISVDASKPAETIARDIGRRLIPTCARLHTEALRLIAEAGQAAAAQARTVAAILAAEPGAHVSPNSDGSTIYLGPTSHGYTVRVDSEASIRFEPFNVDLPAALRILGVLRKRGAGADPLISTGTDQDQAIHEAEDPHCTCNDCVAAHAARLEREA
jgi:hypothetical protein